MDVLTIRDFFKHFDHSCIRCPSGLCRDQFRYEPQLLNSQERTMLASSIISMIHCQYTPLTTHPAFHDQVLYTRKIFTKLKHSKGWSETAPEFLMNQKTFTSALERSCAMMIEWAKKECLPKLVEFFESFAGPDYKPEHHRPPLLEFERLSEVKNWQPSIRQEYFLNLAETLESYAISPRKPSLNDVNFINLSRKSHGLQMFFAQHSAKFPKFTYDVNAYPPNEFRRLCDIAKRMGGPEFPEKEKFNTCYGVTDCWTYYGRVRKSAPITNTNTAGKKTPKSDKQNLSPLKEPPSSAAQPKPVDLYSSPVAFFFKKFNAPGYPDSTNTLPADFKHLSELECKRINFNNIARTWARNISDNELGRRPSLSFQQSEFYKELQDQFYQALEQQFEWFLEFECQRQGLGKEEYLVLFFELKESDLEDLPEGKQRTAEQKRRALMRSLNINIYDFLDYHTELTRLEHALKATDDDTNTQPSLKVLKVKRAHPKKGHASVQNKVPEKPTNFPSLETLGLYCQLTGRVFSYASAIEDETLARLLRQVGGFFAPECRDIYVRSIAANYSPGDFISRVDLMLLGLILRIPGYKVNTPSPRRPMKEHRVLNEQQEAILQRKIEELFTAVRAHQRQSELERGMTRLHMG